MVKNVLEIAMLFLYLAKFMFKYFLFILHILHLSGIKYKQELNKKKKIESIDQLWDLFLIKYRFTLILNLILFYSTYKLL